MKRFDGFGEPERVEQGYSTVEVYLCFGTARSVEVHLADLIGVGGRCLGSDRCGAEPH
jgi:hypothetical protein